MDFHGISYLLLSIFLVKNVTLDNNFVCEIISYAPIQDFLTLSKAAPSLL